MRRISITLPEETFKTLEELSRKTGITNRSRIIADAIMCFSSMQLDDETDYAGAVIIYYNHSKGETTKALMESQHHFLGEIRATTHIHLTRENCIDVLTIIGKGAAIKKLIGDLRKISGVITVQYSLVELT